MEVLEVVPMAPKSPRPKPTPTREVPKPKKDKQKKWMSVHETPRKHAATQAQGKERSSMKEKGKVVDLEAEEGVEDIKIEGVDPIPKLPDYIPPHKGKVKVPEDPDTRQFSLNTPLLLENITFEGPRLARILHLKLEDCDLVDHM